MFAELSDWFASPGILVLGALTGLVFGFLLQKGGVTDFDVITGQFLLRDFTMIKIMLSAIAVGSIGIFGMRAVGIDVGLHVKSTHVLANALGGMIFGVGMVLLGYCPGTGVAAVGDGRKDAAFGVLGMLFGAAVYAEVHPWFAEHVHTVGALGKKTLPEVTGLSVWWFVAAMVAVVLLSMASERKRHEQRRAKAA